MDANFGSSRIFYCLRFQLLKIHMLPTSLPLLASFIKVLSLSQKLNSFHIWEK